MALGPMTKRVRACSFRRLIWCRKTHSNLSKTRLIKEFQHWQRMLLAAIQDKHNGNYWKKVVKRRFSLLRLQEAIQKQVCTREKITTWGSQKKLWERLQATWRLPSWMTQIHSCHPVGSSRLQPLASRMCRKRLLSWTCPSIMWLFTTQQS